jgi:hypothetical protein
MGRPQPLELQRRSKDIAFAKQQGIPAYETLNRLAAGFSPALQQAYRADP